jgi:hypothetical protein
LNQWAKNEKPSPKKEAVKPTLNWKGEVI